MPVNYSIVLAAAVALCALAAGGCRARQGEQVGSADTTRQHSAGTEVAAPDPQATERLRVLTADGFVGFPLCVPLDSVARLFATARDTAVASEEWESPGKVVTLPGGVVVFEGDSSGTAPVWEITVMSPSVSTPRGYRVGMAFDSLRRTDEIVMIREPEGGLVLRLVRERVEVLLDSAAEARFHSRANAGTPPTLSDIPPAARIGALIAGRDCGRLKRD
jgi:hypothetical protein